MPKVFIVREDESVATMFLNRGWTVTSNDDDADLIQFIGGDDINPKLYGQDCLYSTCFNDEIDKIDIEYFNKHRNKKKAGICRGGQLLNVLSGGSMWQDVDNHNKGGLHVSWDYLGVDWYVNSYHHQMMIPGEGGVLLLFNNLSSVRQNPGNVCSVDDNQKDCEAVYYPNTYSLCYQPHPEWVKKNEETQNLYFILLNKWLGLK